MILYHGTTVNRARQILTDKEIRKDCERFFTEEKNGSGYSTDGFVYLSNEITYTAYMANSHCIAEKSDSFYIFRIDIPDEILLPDYDEMRYQDPMGHERTNYSSDLECSLLEFKTCRINQDIPFDKFSVDYVCVDKNDYSSIGRIFDNFGRNYNYVISHYSALQKHFINSLNWVHV